MHKPLKTQTQKHPSKQASHVVGGEESGEEYSLRSAQVGLAHEIIR